MYPKNSFQGNASKIIFLNERNSVFSGYNHFGYLEALRMEGKLPRLKHLLIYLGSIDRIEAILSN